MIKNRELALIPDSALELLEPRATSPVPGARSSTPRPSHAPDTTDGRPPRHTAGSPR